MLSSRFLAPAFLRRAERSTALALSTLLLLLIGTLGAGLVLVVGAIDRATERARAQSVSGAIVAQQRLALDDVADSAAWDDSHAAFSRKTIDRRWAASNIVYAVPTFIIDSRGATVWTGRPTDRSRPGFTPLDPGVARRLAEAALAADAPLPPRAAPVPVGFVDRYGPVPAIHAAAVIRPTRQARDPAAPRRVMVFARPLDQHWQTSFAAAYAMTGLEVIADAGAPTPANRAGGVVLRGGNGEAVGMLRWTPVSTARTVLVEQGGRVALLLSGALLLALAIARHILRSDRALRRESAAAREAANVAQARLDEVVQTRRAADHYRRAASIDALTGLANRRALPGIVRQLPVGAAAVMLLDLDRFKAINDDYGHGAGDIALLATARILSRVLPPGCSALRYGGEEFLVIAPMDMGAAATLAEQLRAAIAAQPRCRCTVSIGVAALDDRSQAGLEIGIARADRALYRAKDSGRDRVMLADQERTAPPAALPAPVGMAGAVSAAA